MSVDENQGGELASKLKLDVKALTLLYESDLALQAILDKTFTESGDSEMLRFARLLQARRRPGGLGALLISVGEIILASFLTVLGIAVFIPALVGLVMPQQFLDYFSRIIVPALASSPLFVVAPVLDFVLASVLMLCAFYTLRQASQSIRESAMILETSVR
ncbi:MAG: hypothetical protein OK474_10345 [Thaumarchaeota archaeon]|nr:hypothetical protein [Nitrososphaerota archaeon]